MKRNKNNLKDSKNNITNYFNGKEMKNNSSNEEENEKIEKIKVEEEMQEDNENSSSTKRIKYDFTGKATFHCHDARSLNSIINHNSIQLVVTSPPYPMIAMWDEQFIEMDNTIPSPDEWTNDNCLAIFEKMHVQLDKVWKCLFSSVCEGGIVIINIGDATRSIEKNFQLFPNGARCTMGMIGAGFTALPNIYWKKPTNGPNAFLGSGFLPVNAYVSIDCEHILIFRKGKLRKFEPKSERRNASKFTFEERNLWFSQTWTGINGCRQEIIDKRRSAAFPQEIPKRLIQMYSIIGDTVLDPFAGTGTTVSSAVELQRNGIGIEKESAFINAAKKNNSQPSVTSFFKSV